MNREELTRYLEDLLEPGRFRDYCPNGLQVEGRPEIGRVVAGVSATQQLLDTAVEHAADTILVHHGWFWRGEDGRVTGIRKTRLQTLLCHDINLYAFHLPLDSHPELGNNVQLARHLDWIPDGRFGEQDLGWLGHLTLPLPARELGERVARTLQRPPLLLGDSERLVRRVAWCSGGAQGMFEQAIALGVDLYLTGEASEPSTHLARESGVAYLAAGHHASERYGIMALAAHLAERFTLDCRFVDLDNPV
ncbi:Nif3-like dinuclear metal center hexameric protein [Accumulibacter sp.]|uniref:Nif3-like dinuclear metal center hexameric protein n=1 Tax=Accumulibacter sp. TaxID=2053492 RepID=UPI0025E6E69E|nr:Nif3-like dinuclear metal center hexameric protein [Accumulibacter sp.]MCM8613583.1 Nif3-like dinuclear metal center hexameric protein [Accumulibacter sp.]MCM8637234.1 Nif3-like dinuclear metal center hexameric protein [Accumulibacter sp.]MCM8638158.1 Nif3-like dinuclear metal center hexameric protein [Accumulibacter sp.]